MQSKHVAVEIPSPLPFSEKQQSQWIACWNPNGFTQWDPDQSAQQYLKPPLAISPHLQRGLTNQEGNVCSAVSWLTWAPGFIKPLHSASVLKDACVNWIPFPRVTLDPLMSRQLNYLLQPLFLPKRFRLRLGHTPLKLFFEILWKASWRI